MTLKTNSKFVDLNDYPLGFAMLNRYWPTMINLDMENLNFDYRIKNYHFLKIKDLCLLSFEVDAKLFQRFTNNKKFLLFVNVQKCNLKSFLQEDKFLLFE